MKLVVHKGKNKLTVGTEKSEGKQEAVGWKLSQ